ncbi:MAG: hypothetical protein M1823_009124, partial [Watsoniomyces obsoletus]
RFIDYTDKTFNIWPIWLCPLKQSPQPTMHPHTKGDLKDEQMLNIGLWGFGPKDPVTYLAKNRALEKTLGEMGGMMPGGGGDEMLQQLAMLRHAGLDRHGPASPGFVHSVAEAAKLGLADRLAWPGDPDFVDVPIGALLSDGYAAERWGQVRDTAST